VEHAIQDFIQFKRIAVVGVSRGGKKFGNKIYNELKQRGYQVYAVNPQIEEIAGEHCYQNLVKSFHNFHRFFVRLFGRL